LFLTPHKNRLRDSHYGFAGTAVSPPSLIPGNPPSLSRSTPVAWPAPPPLTASSYMSFSSPLIKPETSYGPQRRGEKCLNVLHATIGLFCSPSFLFPLWDWGRPVLFTYCHYVRRVLPFPPLFFIFSPLSFLGIIELGVPVRPKVPSALPSISPLPTSPDPLLPDFSWRFSLICLCPPPATPNHQLFFCFPFQGYRLYDH